MGFRLPPPSSASGGEAMLGVSDYFQEGVFERGGPAGASRTLRFEGCGLRHRSGWSPYSQEAEITPSEYLSRNACLLYHFKQHETLRRECTLCHLGERPQRADSDKIDHVARLHHCLPEKGLPMDRGVCLWLNQGLDGMLHFGCLSETCKPLSGHSSITTSEEAPALAPEREDRTSTRGRSWHSYRDAKGTSMTIDFTEAFFSMSADPRLHFKKLKVQPNRFGAGPIESRLLRRVSLQMSVHTHAMMSRGC